MAEAQESDQKSEEEEEEEHYGSRSSRIEPPRFERHHTRPQVSRGCSMAAAARAFTLSRLTDLSLKPRHPQPPPLSRSATKHAMSSESSPPLIAAQLNHLALHFPLLAKNNQDMADTGDKKPNANAKVKVKHGGGGGGGGILRCRNKENED
ncbi:uncharacterized protein LOC121049644 [Rosa chinensis]|uniref:uncharacterized protein LOC121049644 n=1 Tax=Rosa chinensis TaxID=74649 RepID=UPI001AD92007|nr:uncharacterized protein LOC121049644 [Rosa chinensis]